MKIALFGAAGQVGSDCEKALLSEGYQVLSLTRMDVDFANPEDVAKKVAQLSPDFVVNACAYTAVDKAEDDVALADAVNHQSVMSMAKACADLSIPLLHLSTDYVFDGNGNRPYKEDDTVNPLGVYGETKLAGEHAIQQNMKQYIILRTSWVFGENGNNFVKTMLRLASERDQLSVVDDQFGRPSYAGDIVEVILAFVNRYCDDGNLPWGIYHCSSEGETTWYGFAKAIFEKAEELGVIQQKPELSPIPSSQFPTPAPRPAYSVLSTEKLSSVIGGSLPAWEEGLAKFLLHIKA
jgi:dTDP-4-dehydrorhamnose reductase